ncbi:MAG: phage head spike fiber domain-containing protein, partial [Plesiomonas shigelloides]
IKAEQSAATVVGALIDAGPYDASTGIFPTPVMTGMTKQSSIWKVIKSGIAGGIDLSVGDSLVYTSRDDSYYKIDNTESFIETLQAAALPFPDVWIPLNDNLRTLAGFGDEVKVGDYTVATQATLTRNSGATLINKSGEMVSVWVNEPRFEAEGLLNEWQITNLCLQSDITKWGPTKATTTHLSGFLYSVIENTEDGAHNVGGVTCQVDSGKTYSISMVAKKLGSGSKRWIALTVGGPTVSASHRATFDLEDGSVIIHNNALGAKATKKGSIWLCEMQFLAVSIGSLTIGSRLSDRPANTLHTWIGDGVSGVVCGSPQVEALPFATSYIPTNGAAATRDAEKLTIPRLNNECVEWYSGADPITPIVTADTIELVPPVGKSHLRNVRGFFTPLTPEQKASLK